MSNRLYPVPIELKIGVLMWLGSWAVMTWVDGTAGVAIFITSYLVMIRGLWITINRKQK